MPTFILNKQDIFKAVLLFHITEMMRKEGKDGMQ